MITQTLKNIFFILMIAPVLIAVISFLPEAQQFKLTEEGYHLENLQVAFYALTAISCLGLTIKHRSRIWGSMFVLMMAAGARELDLHKAYTEMSLFKSRFYINPDVPLGEKIAGVSLIAILLTSFFYLLYKAFTNRHSLLQNTSPALYGIVGFFTLATAKVFDSIHRLFSEFTTLFSENALLFLVSEEVLELICVVLFLSCTICAWRNTRR